MVKVKFTKKEKTEYEALEKAALDFYSNFKKTHCGALSQHYLLLKSKLDPLRIACAGGALPLEEEKKNAGDEADDGVEVTARDADEEAAKKKKEKKKIKFSDFRFNSKFAKLIEELKNARDHDPTSKSLVFSQFASSLKFLQEELPKHGFQFRTLSGDMPMRKRAKALHDFQNDPPTTIFLLSIRAGAVGINLTQANRVFLLEPSFNPALEHQSIGRVHRLGQKRNVEIVRLVMDASIETRMGKLREEKYGNSSSGEEDSKPRADPVKDTMVGSVFQDKAHIVGREMDLLFGLSTSSTVPAATGSSKPSEAGSNIEPGNLFGEEGDVDDDLLDSLEELKSGLI